MPAQLEISNSDNEQQPEKTKSQSEATKEITAELIKHESENHHDHFQTTEETETTFQSNNHNKLIESIPDIIDSPPELIQDVPSKPEILSELSSQPDIVPETVSISEQLSKEPEVCTMSIRHSEESESVRQNEPEEITSEEATHAVASEPVIEVFSQQPALSPVIQVQADPSPEPASCTLVNQEITTLPEPELSAVVVKAEPKIVAEVPPDTVKSLIRQSEHEVPKATNVVQNGIPKKVQMLTSIDEGAVRAAYEDVRADNTDTQWAVFKFQGSCIVKSAVGSEFEKFRAQFTENERAFGFIRVQVGDELSKRQKFVFITWVGPSVSVIQRAKMSTDKALMKNIISNFAVELQPENLSEIDLDHFVKELIKAGGANYGTGVREL